MGSGNGRSKGRGGWGKSKKEKKVKNISEWKNYINSKNFDSQSQRMEIIDTCSVVLTFESVDKIL